MTEPATTATTSPPYPTRFGWGMRLFLVVLLFDMTFRSFSVLWPTGEWGDELGMRLMPVPLPSRAEIVQRAEIKDLDYRYSIREDVCRSLDSVWEFFRPWPEPAVRQRIASRDDAVRWGLCWLTSRLEFVENVAGINEEWPMFSPSVSRAKWLTRARLVYADGSERIVRGLCDPADLTRYAHWFEEKRLDHELKVGIGHHHANDSFGYCNLLRHRYPSSDSGAALVRIFLFTVHYDYPPPDTDARAWLAAQTGPPEAQVYPDFYRFDVKANHGECLLDRYDN